MVVQSVDEENNKITDFACECDAARGYLRDSTDCQQCDAAAGWYRAGLNPHRKTRRDAAFTCSQCYCEGGRGEPDNDPYEDLNSLEYVPAGASGEMLGLQKCDRCASCASSGETGKHYLPRKVCSDVANGEGAADYGLADRYYRKASL